MVICTNKLELTLLDDRVAALYKLLMNASTAQDSVYIKAKETLQSVLDDAGLDARERARILAETLASMVTGISAQSLQGAIDLAKDGRDSQYVLAKLCADTDLTITQKNKMLKDIDNVVADTNVKIGQGWLQQGQMYRDYGAIPNTLVYANPELANTDYTVSYGTKYESIRQAQAGTYNTYAGTYRANGYVSVLTNPDGSLSSGVSADSEGLVYAQTNVAIRQERGFDDNMRQHVANSSSSMISLLLSTEASGIDYTPYLAKWSSSVDYLNVSANVTAGIVTILSVPASIDLSIGNATISGNTVGILAGTAVEVVITDGSSLSRTLIALVQLDYTWSVTFDSSDLSGLVPATGNVTATVIDQTSKKRTDIDTVILVA